ncbi:MAG: hypothetical protein QNL12_08100 [Acidimicrobiia bacterium]|nr:hypothetical protein [Acidimicrobiia bacterium]MDX2467261.1 hypothetical protein [Acidimicrobiia bacterium]
MTTERVPLPRIEAIHPFRGFLGMLGVEMRVWFPWRVAMLTIAGLGIFATIYIPWQIAGVNQLGPLFLWSMALWLIVILISTISLSEGTVLGDIDRGTMSWLVAMPIGRPAIITAKAAAAASGVGAAVFITGGLLYPFYNMAAKRGITEFTVEELTEVTGSPIGHWGAYISLPDAGTYLSMLFAIALLAAFLVALMILLGTSIRSRTAVFGLGLAAAAVLIVGWLVARETLAASPVGLVTAVAEGIQDRPVEVLTPATVTLALSIAFVALAIWRFERRELS